MADKSPYRVGPGDGPDPGSDSPLQDRHGNRIEKSGPDDPLPLEEAPDAAPRPEPKPATDEPPDVPSSIESLDICPNCGADMPGTGTLVCLRCGFNLKTLKVEQTTTGEAALPDDDDDDEPKEKVEPLASPGQGNLRLPGIMAGCVGLVLALAYLAGAASLYRGDVPGFSGRLGALLREVVVVSALTGCGMAALLLLARYALEVAVGDVRLALTRLLAAIVTARLATFLSIPIFSIEFTIEAAVIAVVYAGLLMYFFVLDMRDAALAMALTLFIFLILLGVSSAVYWGIL